MKSAVPMKIIIWLGAGIYTFFLKLLARSNSVRQSKVRNSQRLPPLRDAVRFNLAVSRATPPPPSAVRFNLIVSGSTSSTAPPLPSAVRFNLAVSRATPPPPTAVRFNLYRQRLNLFYGSAAPQCGVVQPHRAP